MGQSIPVRFEELKSSGALPSPTGVGMRILEITRTDDYSVDEMADAIMSDPSLTGRILQLANNASVAGSESVTTVTGAIMRLGSSTVRTLALAFSLVSEREAGARSASARRSWRTTPAWRSPRRPTSAACSARWACSPSPPCTARATARS